MNRASSVLVALGSLACGARDTPVDLVALSSGTDHSCGVTRAGSVVCWGDNEAGGLGNATRHAVLGV